MNRPTPKARARQSVGLGSAMGWSLFAVFILAPLAFFAFEMASALPGAMAEVYGGPGEGRRLLGLLGRSVGIAAAAATLTILAGALVFAAFEPLGPKARSGLWFVASLPIFIPAHFEAIGWIQMIGRAGWLTRALGAGDWMPGLLYNWPGAAAVHATHIYPLGLGVMWIGWRSIGWDAIEAGRTMMKPGRLWSAFFTGWMRRWIAVGWLISFILVLLDYSAALLLRQNVFTVEIVTAFNVYYDPARALALALPLMGVSFAAAVGLGLAFSRSALPVFSRTPGRLARLSARVRVALASAAALWMFAALGVPLATFALTAGGAASYRTVLSSARPQIGSSLIWSAIGAGGVLIIGTLLAATSRSAGQGSALARVRRLVPGVLMVALFALPASIGAIAQIQFWNAGIFGRLGATFYDSGWLLPVGWAVLFAPIVYWAVAARRAQTPAILMDLERLAPRGRATRRWWAITAPRLARVWTLCAIIVFVLAMQEVHAAMLLVSPGQETLAIRAFTLLHYAPDSLLAALCLVSLGAIAAGALAIWGGALAARLILRSWFPDCALD